MELTNSRQLSTSEVDCVDKCATKFVKFNQKLMMNFMRAQNDVVGKKIKLAEEQMLQENQSATTNQQEVLVQSS